jgi:hypothetical protein
MPRSIPPCSTSNAPNPRVVAIKRLTNDFRGKSGRLLTDGVYIYFLETTENGSALAFVSVRGGEPRVIPTGITVAELADINIEKSELLVIGARPGHNERKPWAIALPSGSARQLAGFDANSACWSPDAARIGYSSDMDLYVSGANGTAPARLATLPGLVTSPRWSPDGRCMRVAVVKNRADTTELWQVGTDGKNSRRLVGGGNGSFPGTWSAGGGWFIFSSVRDGRSDLWAIADQAGLLPKPTHAPIQVTDGLMSFSDPVFSSDGRRVFAIGDQPHAGLVRYEGCMPKFRVLGVSLAPGPRPVPVSGTVRGLPGASPVTMRLPVRLPN